MQNTRTATREVWLEVLGDTDKDGPYAIDATTTARDLLAMAGRQGWWLYAPDGRSFGLDDVLIGHLGDKQTLRVANAGPREVAEVGVEALGLPELPADTVWRQGQWESEDSGSA